jgi:hypothetical protein
MGRRVRPPLSASQRSILEHHKAKYLIHLSMSPLKLSLPYTLVYLFYVISQHSPNTMRSLCLIALGVCFSLAHATPTVDEPCRQVSAAIAAATPTLTSSNGDPLYDLDVDLAYVSALRSQMQLQSLTLSRHVSNQSPWTRPAILGSWKD